MAGSVPGVHKADGRLEWVPGPAMLFEVFSHSSFLIGTDPSLRNRPNPAPTLRA